MNEESTKVDVINSTAQSQLKTIVDRVERLNEDLDAVKTDIKEVYAEAKGNGFDVKIIKKIIRLRKQSKASREEEAALISLYGAAIGEQL